MSKFETTWLTDAGIKTDKVNEDSCVVCADMIDEEEIVLLAVADGVGGLNAGDKASRLVVDAVQGCFKQCVKQEMPAEDIYSVLVESIAKANELVLNLSQKSGLQSGTTLTVLLLAADGYRYYHIGDSRAYHISDKSIHKISQLTKDDSETVPKQTADGRVVMKAYLVECIGIKQDLCYQQGHGAYSKGDIFMLCTDGIFKKLPEAVLQKAVRRRRSNMEALCRDLVKNAKQLGETDNLTIAAVRII